MTQIETHVDRFVRNCWYVAGWEDEISADNVARANAARRVDRLLSRGGWPDRCA